MTTHDWRELYRQDGENIVIIQSWWNKAPSLILVAAVVVALLYATWLFPELMYLSTDFFGMTLQLPVLVVFPLGLLAWVAHDVVDDRLVLTPDYLLMIDGLASWTKRTVRLEYHRIQEIEIENNLLQQAFGLGNIRITPIVVGLDESVLLLHGVRQPRVLKDLLLSRIHDREKNILEELEEATSDV